MTLKDSNRQSFSASQSVISFFLSGLVQLIRNPAGGSVGERKEGGREKEKVSAAKQEVGMRKKQLNPPETRGKREKNGIAKLNYKRRGVGN